MSDLKPTGDRIRLGKNDYKLLFSLNVVDDVQDKFDTPISELPKLMQDPKKQIKNVLQLLAMLVNEGIDFDNDMDGGKRPHIDARFVGRYIDANNVGELKSKILNSMVSGIPKQEDDADPNPESGQ